MITNNIDLNIWDRLGYETEYEQEGWVITMYTIEEEGKFYGSGRELPYQIVLTPREVKRLTLGKSMAEGGDYSSDCDFWMDMVTFYITYRDIPRRVDRALRQVVKNLGYLS